MVLQMERVSVVAVRVIGCGRVSVSVEKGGECLNNAGWRWSSDGRQFKSDYYLRISILKPTITHHSQRGSNKMTTPTGLKSPRLQALDSEIELLTSSLLPTETLTSSPRDQWPRFVVIASTESQLAVHVRVDGQYPHQSAVKIDVKGASDGREEAEGWKEWVKERMEEWDGDTE